MSTYKLNVEEKQLLQVKNDHQWRARKRREMNAVIKAAEVYLLGSAYTPMSACDTPPEAASLMDLVRAMREKLTVKRWGR